MAKKTTKKKPDEIEPLVIHRLEVEGFRRIRAVQIDVDGGIVRISGANGAGKSSLLDAIRFALEGKRAKLPEPVRGGVSECKVELDIGEYIVRRRQTQEGRHSVEVLAADSKARMPSPQRVLTSLMSPEAMEPMEFLDLPPRELANRLARLLDLDFADLDARRAAAYESRTRAGHVATALRGELEQLPAQEPGDPPTTPARLTEELSETRTALRRAVAAEKTAEDARTALQATVNEVAVIDRQIAQLRTRRTELMDRYTKRRADAESAISFVTAFDTSNRSEALEERLRDLEAMMGQVAEEHATYEVKRGAWERRRALEERLGTARAQIDQMTKQILANDELKARMIGEARFPVEGLGFSPEGTVTLHGHDFAAASHAEKLRVLTAMCFLSNPRLRVVLLRDASLLDQDSLRLVAEITARHGGQTWIETVGAGESGFVLEEGELAPKAPRRSKPQPPCGECGAVHDEPPYHHTEPCDRCGEPTGTVHDVEGEGRFWRCAPCSSRPQATEASTVDPRPVVTATPVCEACGWVTDECKCPTDEIPIEIPETIEEVFAEVFAEAKGGAALPRALSALPDLPPEPDF